MKFHVVTYIFAAVFMLASLQCWQSLHLPHSVKVALTRERGCNDKLEKLLPELNCVELPCIAFQQEPGVRQIATQVRLHDLVMITSPQAADVFLEQWNLLQDKPKLRFATVGEGTSKPLVAQGLQCDFEPSEATAKCLARELPLSLGKKILYPCSAIASNTLASDLSARGFEVTRLETYRTVAAPWTDEEYEAARSADIVTFASPSTVKVWRERIGTKQIAVVIGPTSEKAAKEAGFQQIFSPEEGCQGIQAWAQLIQQVAKSMVDKPTR